MNIIQTWKTKEVPKQYEAFVNNVKVLHPHANYMFFDDRDIVDFIIRDMPEYYETFVSLTSTIQQIDFFRYLAIYYYGGLYLDLDVFMERPFEFSRDESYCYFPVEQKDVSDALLVDQGFSTLIGNYAFYAPKRHPFIKKIIDNIVCQRIDLNDIEAAQKTCTDNPLDVFVYYRTGPILVTQSYLDADEKNDIVLIEPTLFIENRFGNFGIHCCFGTWRNP
jgi:mannosyltransferase OCH1-like enzyme